MRNTEDEKVSRLVLLKWGNLEFETIALKEKKKNSLSQEMEFLC